VAGRARRAHRPDACPLVGGGRPLGLARPARVPRARHGRRARSARGGDGSSVAARERGRVVRGCRAPAPRAAPARRRARARPGARRRRARTGAGRADRRPLRWQRAVRRGAAPDVDRHGRPGVHRR
jgi:hypothetical protein